MGQKMLAVYEAIGMEDGMRGQMRLAMMTGITTATAKDVPDTPEKLAEFASAYKQITNKECPVRF
jgi:hypothetical protein